MIIKRDYNKKIFAMWWQIDKTIFYCFLLLLAVGLLLITTTSPFVAVKIRLSPFYFIINHLIYLSLFLAFMFFILLLNDRQLLYFIIIGFLLALFLTAMVFVLGSEIKGAKRWIYFFGFSIQPSELIKAFFAGFLVFLWQILNLKLNNKLSIYLIISLVYILIISFLMLQPDFGMTILITSVFMAFLFISGVYLWVFTSLIFGVMLLGVGAYFLLPHVAFRVNSFFATQESYQVNKAMSAIYNGKILGTGPGQGVFKEYLPDSHTDFIFTVATEEFGVLFNLLIILLYAIVFVKAILIAKKTTDLFKSFTLVLLAITLALQTAVHMLSNVNLIPTKGMTLPLISYGGSSLLSSIIIFALILALSKKQIN